MQRNPHGAGAGASKSSAHGLLSTLLARGGVSKGSADRYVIVEEFQQGFGWVGGFEALLRSVAQPIVEQMRDETGETVFVCVRTQDQDARLICKAVSRQPVRYDAADQSRLPGYGTVMGRMLLAYQSPKIIDAYFARTGLQPFNETIVTDEAAIRAELARFRHDGYGTIKVLTTPDRPGQEVIDGLRALEDRFGTPHLLGVGERQAAR